MILFRSLDFSGIAAFDFPGIGALDFPGIGVNFPEIDALNFPESALPVERVERQTFRRHFVRHQRQEAFLHTFLLVLPAHQKFLEL